MKARIDGTLYHWRGLSLSATSIATAKLAEGPCQALRVSADDSIVFAQPEGRPWMIRNGDFAAGSDQWTLTSGWTIANGKATHAGAGVTTLSQATGTTNANDPIIAGRTYLVIFTVSGRTTGTVQAALGTATGTSRNTNATFVEAITAATNGTLSFTPGTSFDGSIDDVYVIPATPPLKAGMWDTFGCSHVAAVAANATPTTLSTAIIVTCGWYSRTHRTEVI